MSREFIKYNGKLHRIIKEDGERSLIIDCKGTRLPQWTDKKLMESLSETEIIDSDVIKGILAIAEAELEPSQTTVMNKRWGKRPCHQISLYYNVHLVDDNIPLDGVFHGYDELDNERIDLDFCWVTLEDLKKGTKVYPLELIPYILEPGKEIVHFVSKQI